MRHLFFIIALLFCLEGLGQEVSAGILKTKTIKLEGIEDIEIGIKAKVQIDCSAQEGVEIQAIESLIDQVEVHLRNGRLVLGTNSSIEQGEEILIKIGAPNLDFVQVNNEAEVSIFHIDQAEISAMALSGNISLEGKTEQLNANGELGTVDARKLVAKIVRLNFWDAGEAKLGSPEKIVGKTRKTTRLTYQNEPKENLHTYSEINLRNSSSSSSSNSNSNSNSSSNSKVRNPDARFIKFDLKNNSLNRIQCYVKGPKPDGSTFSYGFPMNPGQKRDKYWSVGSKVYRVNHMGLRKLLLVIKEEDEGQVVKMYDKD